MALESGPGLGSYEIDGLLDKGGIGEVYRARDTKLSREVTIKVLPSEFSQDQERLARLERECWATLNHLNIAAIRGPEESDDTRFLVPEPVEGGTLRDRLKRGAMLSSCERAKGCWSAPRWCLNPNRASSNGEGRFERRGSDYGRTSWQ